MKRNSITPTINGRRPIKHAGWIALVIGLASFGVLCEAIKAIHGPGWALEFASAAMSLAWLGFVYLIGSWAEGQQRQVREEEQRSTQAE